MSKTDFIVGSFIIFNFLFIASLVVYRFMKFNKSDAAGNALEQGFTFFLGLIVFLGIAVVLAIINAYLIDDSLPRSVKVIAFLPLLSPILTFLFEVFEIRKWFKP